MAHTIHELPIYSKVVEFWSAVNALLDKPRLRNDRDLHEQISRANNSIPSNMVEGFEQSTDKAFANFLTYSKGSLAEVLTRLNKRISKTTSRPTNSNRAWSPGKNSGRCWGDSSSIYVDAVGKTEALTTQSLITNRESRPRPSTTIDRSRDLNCDDSGLVISD